MMRRQFLGSGLLLSGALTGAPLITMSRRAQSSQTRPDFIGLDGWINSEPIPLASLRGSVVLVNFWTYSCINSRRPMVYLKRWHAEYGRQGLRTIGIHTPEFRFERDRSNVESYIRQEGLRFPVGMDNAYATWNAFNNDAWPTFYLIDRSGRVVLVRAGEDHAHEIELAILGALGLAVSEPIGQPGDDPDLSRIGTPETYFGAQHSTPQDVRQSPRLGTATYSFAGSSGPKPNEYLLDGSWTRQGERLTLASARGALRFRFSAAKLYMVAGSARAASLSVRVDGIARPPVEIGWPTLYTIVDGNAYGEHLLELTADSPGLTLYSATFG
ncbi:MAG TPA: redoxin domain-containing protein [Acetobacteraceae bacterium]|nr:redoxin domain-containing protein [Acetobacteraceae bacterium]